MRRYGLQDGAMLEKNHGAYVKHDEAEAARAILNERIKELMAENTRLWAELKYSEMAARAEAEYANELRAEIAQYKDKQPDALRQQVIDTLTAIGLPSMMMSGERACQLLRELLVAARGIPPAIGQSIGHSIGHGEPVHDFGCEVQA